ncbi:hypothetical protein TEA_021561 [Camellia sinensis var. sinensis]|uniref:SURP motif domain-containing protein n=1 Tax=Camellia sinensis var. sinensis TaxID=542762 RepID=A0A4S4ESV5_CAMSN|nr:hypothetical protein TEA_021561 [Camellia sinensis var. sinensis]
METNKDSIVDVRSVVEAISSDDNDAPLYQVESLWHNEVFIDFDSVLQKGMLLPSLGNIVYLKGPYVICPVYLQFAGELQPRGCHYQLNFPPAMAFVQQQTTNIQQQQQFGFHQQFPPSVHGPPFLPPHPSLQQYPFPRHMQQPHQLHPHPPPYPHLLHLQRQQQPPPVFPPHMPPHLVPSPFIGPYDSPPHPAAPLCDPELQKRIDKLVEYAAKNGPEVEAMIHEKQQDNPDYSFLFGGEGHNYYRYKLWLSTHGPGGPFNPPFPSSSMPMMCPPNPMMNQSSLNAPPLGGPQMHQPPFTPPFYEQQQHQQHSQPFVGHGWPDYDHSSRSFKGLSGPLPSDVAMEMNNVLNNLTGTKESIKGAKIWFIQRSPFALTLAEALRDRVFGVDDSERQLHIIYLANDILFDSLQRRMNLYELDNEALAFKPVLAMPSSLATQPFLPNSVPTGPFTGSIPIQSSLLPTNQQTAPHLLPPSTGNTGEKLPPYPLFPPGLIPGMVRKMQIDSGVPYSPMSPLDIPTVIPPSNVSPSEILNSVSKFFKEIGEVNPSEGPMNGSDSKDDDDEYERDSPVRKGGACIPPPPNLQVDPETETYADGSVERKPGSSSSRRLGLGAAPNPNEASQYDDVYSSYRKQRSSNYHTSMSARVATARIDQFRDEGVVKELQKIRRQID